MKLFRFTLPYTAKVAKVPREYEGWREPQKNGGYYVMFNYTVFFETQIEAERWQDSLGKPKVSFVDDAWFIKTKEAFKRLEASDRSNWKQLSETFKTMTLRDVDNADYKEATTRKAYVVFLLDKLKNKQ